MATSILGCQYHQFISEFSICTSYIYVGTLVCWQYYENCTIENSWKYCENALGQKQNTVLLKWSVKIASILRQALTRK